MTSSNSHQWKDSVPILTSCPTISGLGVCEYTCTHLLTSSSVEYFLLNLLAMEESGSPFGDGSVGVTVFLQFFVKHSFATAGAETKTKN